MILTFLSIILGLSLLTIGGHLLVKTCISLAVFLKKKIFFISMLLIGMGTSAPELFVTIQSHLNFESELAIANILGSNIFNILVVASLITLSSFRLLHSKNITQSSLLLFIFTALFSTLLFDHSLSRLDGLLLLALFSIFILKTSEKKEIITPKTKTDPFIFIIPFMIIGFVCLFFGAQITIQSTIELGNKLGISRRIVGLLLVSIGTSIPELAVGIAALVKRKTDIALGGIIGSNAFNTFLIPGVASLMRPLPVAQPFVLYDIPVVLLSTLFLFLYLTYIKKKSPWVGIIFLLSYLAYVSFVLFERV